MPTRYIGDGYWEIASRQMSIVTRSEQQRFKDAKVTVIGCGGIGGHPHSEMMIRPYRSPLSRGVTARYP